MGISPVLEAMSAPRGRRKRVRAVTAPLMNRDNIIPMSYCSTTEPAKVQDEADTIWLAPPHRALSE